MNHEEQRALRAEWRESALEGLRSLRGLRPDRSIGYLIFQFAGEYIRAVGPGGEGLESTHEVNADLHRIHLPLAEPIGKELLKTLFLFELHEDKAKAELELLDDALSVWAGFTHWNTLHESFSSGRALRALDEMTTEFAEHALSQVSHAHVRIDEVLLERLCLRTSLFPLVPTPAFA